MKVTEDIATNMITQYTNETRFMSSSAKPLPVYVGVGFQRQQCNIFHELEQIPLH